MQGESTQFYIFLAILLIGGVVIIFLTHILRRHRKIRPKATTPIDPIVSKRAALQNDAVDLASILSEVMEKIPAPSSSSTPSSEPFTTSDPVAPYSTSVQINEADHL